MVGQAKTHGEPLGDANVAKTREQLGWPGKEPFEVPGDLLDWLKDKAAGIGTAQQDWQSLLERYQEAWPEQAAELARCLSGDRPDLMSDEAFWQFSGSQATRRPAGFASTAWLNGCPT